MLLTMTCPLPKDVDEYVHRVGRSGSVGNVGKATSFFDPSSDAEVQGPLVRLLTDSGVEMPGFLSGDGDFGDGGAVGGGAAAGGGDDDEW